MELFLHFQASDIFHFFQRVQNLFQNRKLNYFSYFWASDQKLLLQHFLHITQGVQNWFSKQEMELSKQKKELFLPILGLWSKKTFFITYSPYLPKNSKWIFKTGNEIIQTGYGIISPNSGPLIKNNFYNIFSIFTKEYKIDFKTSKCKNFPPSWPLIQNFLLPLSNYLFFCSSEAVKVYTYIWEKPGNLAPPPFLSKSPNFGRWTFWFLVLTPPLFDFFGCSP